MVERQIDNLVVEGSSPSLATNNKGFTIVEGVLVVFFIIGILALILVPSFMNRTKNDGALMNVAPEVEGRFFTKEAHDWVLGDIVTFTTSDGTRCVATNHGLDCEFSYDLDCEFSYESR